MEKISTKPLVVAVHMALATNLSGSVSAETFPAEIQLSTLDGSIGFTINGDGDYDKSGISVSGGLDINGDGIDDLIIGAEGAKPNGYSSGKTYVLYGTNQGFPNIFELSGVDGTNGFVINGEAPDDESGASVSSAGDVNGDGIDDLVIGAWRSDPNGPSSGRSYVVFGSDTDLPHPLELSSLDGMNGFALNGRVEGGRSGRSVSGIGDINGDGIDDLIIRSFYAGINGGAHVVFGRSTGFSSEIDLADLDGSNGFLIIGGPGTNGFGSRVGFVGDINNDGINDLAIGLPFADPNGDRSGATALIFGSSAGFGSTVNLSALDDTEGVIFNGERDFNRSGESVSGVGDINGDGIDDLVISSWYRDYFGESRGDAYVIFGSDALPSPFELSAIDGSNGFVVYGENAYDAFGRSVTKAGDINGDGIDDVIFGASGSYDVSNVVNTTGSAYVLFGSAAGFTSPFDLNSINGLNGVSLTGISTGDRTGFSVSGVGDVNNDGLDDIIVGAPRSRPNNTLAGRSYVVFGRDGLFSDGFENGSSADE